VDWADAVAAACAAKRSIRPGDALPDWEWPAYPETVVQVSNETTLGGASWRLVERGMRPLALNFANRVHPGGGFLGVARAQEEVLCPLNYLENFVANYFDSSTASRTLS
jgi:uncharacterized protein (TIGR02452 family)